MRSFKVPGKESRISSAAEARRRLVLLAVSAFVVIALVWGGLWYAASIAVEGDPLLPPLEAIDVEETVALPEIDGARLDSLVSDSTPERRVILESEALDAIIEPVRALTPRHFETLEAIELDAAGIAAILEGPSARRGDAFIARGWIEGLRKRHRGPGNAAEHIGRVLLEDESSVHFLVLDVPEDLVAGDYVRIDGLFLKVFSDESSEDGREWIDAPLLVGPRMIRSFPAIGAVSQLDKKYLYTITDDVLAPEGGEPSATNGLPQDALWHLMSYVRDLPPDAVDWSDAPELDRDTIREVAHNGDEYRLQPFRFPISRLQGVRVRKAGENPSRIDEYTTGWIGNTTWKHVAHFQAPAQYHDLRMSDYVFGHGFFFKNFAYESALRGERLAPVFVLHSLEKMEPKTDPIFKILGYTIAALFLLFLGLFSVLMTRDRRRGQALQAELGRRRRARQARRLEQPAETNPS